MLLRDVLFPLLLKLHLFLVRDNECEVKHIFELFFFNLVMHAHCIECLILDYVSLFIFHVVYVDFAGPA